MQARPSKVRQLQGEHFAMSGRCPFKKISDRRCKDGNRQPQLMLVIQHNCESARQAVECVLETGVRMGADVVSYKNQQSERTVP